MTKRRNHGRSVRPRQRVLTALDPARGFRSAQDLFVELRSAGHGVGIATIYRTLGDLALSGDVDVLRPGDGPVLYRRCAGGRHHHHLVCRSCGKTEEVGDTRVERWVTALGKERGYEDLEHTLEIFGQCAKCSRSRT